MKPCELLKQAWEARERDEHDVAIRLYLQCIEEDSQNAEAYRELALVYYGFKKDTMEAARLLQISLSLADSADAHLYLALAMEKLGSKIEARSEFEAALKGYEGNHENPLFALACFFYGEFLDRLGEIRKAHAKVKEAVLHEPQNEKFKQLLIGLQEAIDAEAQPSD